MTNLTLKTLCLSLMLTAAHAGIIAGELPFQIDGTVETWYVAMHGAPMSASLFSISAGELSVSHGGRGYLVASNSSTFTPALYSQKLFLVGKQLNFTLDLSATGCGCWAGIYAVAMPGVDAQNAPFPNTGGDYYCDANAGGNFCPEFDFAEANQQALQQTPHTCTLGSGNYYTACNGKQSCHINTLKNFTSSVLSPSASSTVNTLLPFTVSTQFLESGGVLTGIHSTISQGGNSFSFSLDDSNCGSIVNFADLGTSLDVGMVLTMSLVGGGANTNPTTWLDGLACPASAVCSPNSVMKISDISLVTLPGSGGPTNAPGAAGTTAAATAASATTGP